MTSETTDLVCGECGVDVAQSRARGLVHTSELPRGVRPHDARAVTREAYVLARDASAIKVPLDEARDWAQKQRERMLREEMQGVVWGSAERHAVVLLSALEQTESTITELVGGQEQALKFLDQISPSGYHVEQARAALKVVLRP